MKKAKLNFIDKAVAFLNPQGAVDRLVARQKLTKFEYDAVKYTRERKGPSSLSGAEDYRSNYDRVELMKRARDLAENVGLVRSLLLKFAGHVAGSISYQARTSNPQANSDIEAFWAEWWDKCDISTRHTGGTLMQVAVMSMLRDGDFLFVLVRDADGNLKVQGIEADRLGDPFKVYTSLELIGGIHIDRATGAPTAYDIYNRSIGDFYTYQATISASQAFHLFDPLRIDQYRGVSAFHTAINDATDIYELTSFEKMAAKTASAQSAIVKRNNNNAADLSTLSTDEDISGNVVKLETIESGKISYLEPGEDIIFPNGPSRPSGAFMEFHKVLMRNICLGLGIPYSFAVDPSAMSGPTARLEMQQAGRTFRRYQNLLNDKVLRPLKNIVIADAVSRGLISSNAGTQSTRGIFNFGANVSIDLGRESASAIAEFKSGLRTGSDIYAERGADWETSMRQRAIEAKAIQDLAKEYGVPAETISDIVSPAKSEPQMPMPQLPQPPQKDEGEEPEEGDEPEPVEPLEPSSENLEEQKSEESIFDPSEIEEPSQKKSEELEDCGTGAGGFKPGNTCAGGEGGQEEKSRSSATIKYAPEVLPGQSWGDNGQKFTEDGRAVKAEIGEFTITDADGALAKGPPYAVKRLSKKTKEDLIKEISNPETVEAMRMAGINNIVVSGTSKTPDGNTFYGAHNKNDLIIHTRTSDVIAASTDEYRVKHGFKRLIHHEIGHGVWDNGREESRGAFTNALKQNPEITERISKLTRTQYSPATTWDETKTNRIVTESFAELNGMKRFDKDGYAKLPKGIKDSIEQIEKDAKDTSEAMRRIKGDISKRKGQSLEALKTLSSADIKMLIAGMMGGIELGKYDGIDFTPPEGAREAAKRALDVREKKPASQKGMTPVGIARARDLINGVKFSPDTVRRMKAFFDRHEVDKKGSTWDEQGKGWQAWNGWGGDAGYAWARKVVRQMEARDNDKELARPGPKSTAQTPAPPKERIKGSKENPEGTAATRSKAGDIEISEANEQALKDKIAEFKKDHPQKNAPSLGTLKKVFRRGAGAFSTSFRPTISGGKPNSRNAWAMARVNKFLKMAGGGEVKESYRKADGDLL